MSTTDPPASPPAAGQPPAAPPATPPASPPAAGYVTQAQLDAKVDPLAGKLDQLLGIVGGQAPAGQPAPAAGPSVADQVRAGVEQLRADDAAKAAASQQTADAASWQAGVERRLAAAERKPREPAGRLRGAVQRFVFGIEETGR